MGEYIFPEKFLFGAGTSAFQVEGDIKDSDWRRWEQTKQPVGRRSGKACDHYNRYTEDFDLAKKLGHNAHRLSVEWSRIEPQPGVFDLGEIDHYKDVIRALRDRNIAPLITLHHFSNPAWFADKGGWLNKEAPDQFARFVGITVPQLRDAGADFWVTINEPTVYAQMGFLTGEFVPQMRGFPAYCKVLLSMALAHRKAYQIIHHGSPTDRVGVANSMTAFETKHKNNPLRTIEEGGANIAELTNRIVYLLTDNTHDFLGVNYYFGQSISAFPPKLEQIGSEKSMLGWGVYPEGLRKVIQGMKLPIYITENGIATRDDKQRERFLVAHLIMLLEAIQSGVDVRGYFHWSLLDNMELHRGFEPTFGLVGVDFNSSGLIRTPRPSAYLYRDIIKANGITPEIIRKITA